MGILASMVRWRILLRGQSIDLPFRHIFGSFLIGRFIGTFLPSTAGLDGYKLYDAARFSGRTVEVTATTALEKVIGVFGIFLTFLVALPFGIDIFGDRAGLVAMTQTLAVEWAKYRIKINCIAPGVILSTGMRNYPDGWTDRAFRAVPLKRLGTSDEMAWLVAYLLSPAGDYITGETIKMDGGQSLWGDRWPIPDPDKAPDMDIPPWPEDRWPEFVNKEEAE